MPLRMLSDLETDSLLHLPSHRIVALRAQYRIITIQYSSPRIRSGAVYNVLPSTGKKTTLHPKSFREDVFHAFSMGFCLGGTGYPFGGHQGISMRENPCLSNDMFDVRGIGCICIYHLFISFVLIIIFVPCFCCFLTGTWALACLPREST